MRPFLLALQFLTVITLKGSLRARPGEMGRAVAFYGLVGGILGLLLAGAAGLAGLVLPPLALAALITLLWGGLTRFLHYDGLADTADALVHTAERERALAIMKDTRLGTFGVCALVGVMLLKAAALAGLGGWRLAAALVAAPALARAATAMLVVLLPAARPGAGLGAAVKAEAEISAGLWSVLAGVAIAGLAAGRAGLWAALAVLALTLLLGWWYRRRLGGVTGDTLGAAIELCETLALLTLTGLSLAGPGRLCY